MKTEQVIFKDGEGNLLGGILVDDSWVICGECGGTCPIDEVEIVAHLSWADISDAIGGDELYAVPDDDCDYEVGYDPYTGCFSDDC